MVYKLAITAVVIIKLMFRSYIVWKKIANHILINIEILLLYSKKLYGCCYNQLNNISKLCIQYRNHYNIILNFIVKKKNITEKMFTCKQIHSHDGLLPVKFPV